MRLRFIPHISPRIIPAAVLLAASLLAGSAEASVVVNSLISGKAGDQFTSKLNVTNLSYFEAGDFQFTYDSALLTLVGTVKTGSLTSDFAILASDPPIAHAGDSLVDVFVTLSANVLGVTGDGSLYEAVFELLADGSTTLATVVDLTDIGFTSNSAQVGVVNDTTPTDPNAVPITNTAALAALALAALGFTRRKAQQRQA